ncbi:FkbM family methyltransferase [Mucilaginibacter gotjawali]|uniref:FkbM family methyltransferase n=1 Tax=Mucilaginibacter gotjawali TaxID=1550579 RepID=A0A839SFL4_9SPHI|nr:FkbM family methyltransferase [Mucilaginibacter gotjawali]MBB3057095.1 FkbM family methyltransferase [Mucilaginibacter gotjawali]
MKTILSGFVRAVSKVIGKRNLEQLLVFSAKAVNINLHEHALIQIGGSGSLKEGASGERTFLIDTLPCLCKDNAQPVFFDIGANIGNYTLELRNYFPNASIYSFEPVKGTFEKLQNNTINAGVNLYNIGFSDTKGTGTLFNTIDNSDTEIASVYKDVFPEIFKNDNEISPIEFQMDTIDSFCISNSITNIDFLKIDVEGHELSVLKGAGNMLRNGKIRFIQFEFNSHNVYSRVFLRDFYMLLTGFEFYRIVQTGIDKLGPYNTANEIFVQQNILAVNGDVSDCIKDVFSA